MDTRQIAAPDDMGGWELRHEEWDAGDGNWTPMHQAYTKTGQYIGDEDTARHIVDNLGIAPQLASSDHNVCSIGYDALNEKWFGWSHRAMCGFGVGDVITEGHVLVEMSNYEVGQQIRTPADAQAAARAFASAVS